MSSMRRLVKNTLNEDASLALFLHATRTRKSTWFASHAKSLSASSVHKGKAPLLERFIKSTGGSWEQEYELLEVTIEPC